MYRMSVIMAVWQSGGVMHVWQSGRAEVSCMSGRVAERRCDLWQCGSMLVGTSVIQ